MTLITPEAEEARTEELLLSMQASLAHMRQQFEAFTREANSGEEIKETAVNGQLSALSKLIINLQGMEKRLEDARHAKSGIAQNGYAIDHDAARAEIRCALGRLRACGSAGAVSG